MVSAKCRFCELGMVLEMQYQATGEYRKGLEG